MAAWVSSLAIALPPEWFRHFHFAHHRHTQIPGRDPELAEPKPETWAHYLWYLTGVPVWVSHSRTLVRNVLGRCDDAYVPAAALPAVRWEARVMAGAYAVLAGLSVAAGSAVLLWIWVIPAIVGQLFLRLYLLAEHGRCPMVADMFENTRTTLTGPLVRWIAWNMPYHTEHHAFPAVPFHRLPDLHADIRDRLKVVTPGYVAFHREYQAGLGGGPEGAR